MQRVDEPVKDSFYLLSKETKVVPKLRLDLSKLELLSQAQGYVWFSPAAIYLWGQFSDQDLFDYYAKSEVKILWYKFEKPIFSGLQRDLDSSWNHALWAVSEQDWRPLSDFILEILKVDTARKMIFNYGIQEFSVIDPLVADKKVLLPPGSGKIRVSFFGVLTNMWRIAVDLKTSQDRGLPGVVRFKPSALQQRVAYQTFKSKDVFGDLVSRVKDPESFNSIRGIS